MYARMASKGSKVDSFGWNIVAGRQQPRYVQGKGQGARPQNKRQRTSTGSGGSPASASKTNASHDNDNDLSIAQFKSLNIDNKLDTIFVCLQEVKSTNQRLLKAERTVHEIRESTLENKARIDTLAYKSIDLEARQRRNNLIFWGIPEVRNEECMVVISDFLTERLELDPEAICIQRAHRIGRPLNLRRNIIGRAVSNPKHRPLIALFRDYQDVELIISNAGKLKGTSFGINRDYPPEIIAARKPLLEEKRKLKSANPNSNISIQFPAKLIKDGHLIKDMFPNWQDSIHKSRLGLSGIYISEKPPNRRVRLTDARMNAPGPVFQSDSSHEYSDMDHSDVDSNSAQPVVSSAVVHVDGQADQAPTEQDDHELFHDHVREPPLDTSLATGDVESNTTTGRQPNDNINNG